MATSNQTTHLAALFPTADSIPAKHRLGEPLNQRHILINGELRQWDGPVHTVQSPVRVRDAEGKLHPVTVGSFPVTTATESLEALKAAVDAHAAGTGQWPTMSVDQRIAHVQDFTQRLVEKRELIVNLIMWEIGKSAVDSAKEFDRTVDYIRQTIDALKELDNNNSRFQVVEGTIAQIRRAPLGVVLCMGPYNYPLNETFTTLIPALIMGNVILFKPPKFGTLLFAPILEAFRDAFPAGVVNTVYGRGEEVVPPLMASGQVHVLALIGSSRVADKLKKLHPKTNRLRAVLGLDAKNVAIILPDADLDLTVKECVLGSLSFNGQRCTALKTLLVHQSIAEALLDKYCAALAALKIGMPWEDGVFITPLPDKNKPRYLTACIEDAVEKGASVRNAGGGDNDESLFVPAVVYPVNERMRLYREEQFGPVVPIVPFDDVQTALAYVESSDYGQQVSIFGSDADTIATLVDPLVNQVCRVNINCQCQRGPDVFPFTGRKDSAEGTLSVSDALRAFSIRTMVAAKATPDSKALLDDIVLGHKSAFINTRFIF
ncbi:Aldehyde dehydrogenase [Cupriavidus taiwanensis]|uniref:Aldehyde dehydrogenase n=1 Tax=Cupriavidus taiwanensis TaxID=164546 RepID=A0A375ECT4_9BURK|nr:NADP-dependent glyceraldehyde-3-phosphate dehydrogenase [Cupriavidus taiwanensis]SOZ73132.1 Aldehyde dehydrogenase [Cupriavidus taiwanensis]SOZ73712.1 Aldehyde dehydrogenase [Cupriavidus taiwanensis]SOZ75275.1 Aldehyde dehydrogenase [Cupriavidus taiwanensis]SPA03757.1 Aldehyde dehydrogenase [Cupriavidus taiwanensis]SPA12579.1 Aldehyde dehydrogenase [Cupriavidus taiwanensis]